MGPKGAGSRKRGSAEPIIPVATWPEAIPGKYEQKIMSIVCGTSYWHWAVHEGANHNFNPILFWRTPPLAPEERQDDPSVVLGRHLPPSAHEVLFGDEHTPATKPLAASVAATRRIPAMSIYVLSSKDDYDESLNFLFQDYPSRMIKLRNEDFFPILNSSDGETTAAQKDYLKTLAIDRAAKLKAASDMFNTPVLLFDAGTSLTHSALGVKGEVMGGGIGPGVNVRLRGLADYCNTGAPRVNYDEYSKIVLKATVEEKPLGAFSLDLKSQICSDVLGEIAGKCRSTINNFLKDVKQQQNELSLVKEDGNGGDEDKENTKDETTADTAGGAPTPMDTTTPTTTTPTTTATSTTEGTDEETTPKDTATTGATDSSADHNPKDLPVVVVTGGDFKLLEALMAPNHSHIVKPEPDAFFPLPNIDYKLAIFKQLAHHGVSCLLTEITKKAYKDSKTETDVDRRRDQIIGLRLARTFAVADVDGEFTYRGTVISCKAGAQGAEKAGSIDNDWFLVRYDDGDKEHLDLINLYDGLELYKKVGEKPMLLKAAKSANIVDLEAKAKYTQEEKEEKDKKEPPRINVEDSLKRKMEATTNMANEILKTEPSVVDEQKKRAEAKTRGAAAPSRGPKPAGMFTAKKRMFDDKKGASPAVKKARKSTSPPKKKLSLGKNKKTMYLQKRVAKEFQQEDETGKPFTEVYFGTIDTIVSGSDDENPLWHVLYDDDDEEEYDEKDIKKGLKLYEREKVNDTNAPGLPSVTSDVEMDLPPGGPPKVGGSDNMEVDAPSTETTDKKDMGVDETAVPSPAAPVPALSEAAPPAAPAPVTTVAPSAPAGP